MISLLSYINSNLGFFLNEVFVILNNEIVDYYGLRREYDIFSAIKTKEDFFRAIILFITYLNDLH